MNVALNHTHQRNVYAQLTDDRVIETSVSPYFENRVQWTNCVKPVLFGTAILAYAFGLRRVVDADHVAAIDNVMNRKPRNPGEFEASGGRFESVGSYHWKGRGITLIAERR